MSIRTINFNVEADKITPSSLQRGGLQGEHNATELVFEVENSLVEKLQHASQGGTIYYRFEGHTGIGMKNSTLPVVLNIPDDYSNGFYLNYLLENWLTHEGGNITVYLIFSIISKAETLVDLYSYPARLRLEAVPDGKYTDGKNYESVAKLSVAAEDAAERAENAAEISEAAKEQTVDARFALENGAEFIFMGGDAKGAAEVDLVVDSELSEYSSNPISNEATAKEFQKYTPTEEGDERYVGTEDYALDKKNADEERSKMKEKLDTITDHISNYLSFEYGWYTPKFTSNGEDIDATYEHAIGYYYRLGALVHFWTDVKGTVNAVNTEYNYAGVSIPVEVGAPQHVKSTVSVGECYNLTAEQAYNAIISPDGKSADLKGGYGEHAIAWKIGITGWVKVSGTYLVAL